MAACGPLKKGSSSPSWVRTAKFVAVMVTILVLLGATDLPGSGSIKRLAVATGLAMTASDPGEPFPRPERRSLFAQKSGNAKLPDPFRTNERPKLTPEEEKRRREVIKIYEEAKAEAAKEETRKVAREAENAKRLEAERAAKAAKKAAAKSGRKESVGEKAQDAAGAAQDKSAQGERAADGKAKITDTDSKRESRDETASGKIDAGGRKSGDGDADMPAADADDKSAKQDTA